MKSLLFYFNEALSLHCLASGRHFCSQFTDGLYLL